MWFLEQKYFDRLEKLKASKTDFSPQIKADFLDMQNKSNISTKKNGIGIINVKGLLTAEPDYWAVVFGLPNTTYKDISDALINMQNDLSIKSIELHIDSPGGEGSGLFKVLADLDNVQKPIFAIVDNLATSAAYAIASKADKIIARLPTAIFGSIGVAATYYVYDSVVDITSTNAPKKRPDVTTDEGKADVVEYLDQVEALFIDEIARGRKTTAENIKENFGKGGVLLAENAKKVGMIDELSYDNSQSQSFINTNTEVKNMNLTELKKEHSEIFMEVQNDAIKKERDRVVAHLTMGESSGDMKTAINAVKNGDEMTATLQAIYMSATMNKNQLEARVEENPEKITEKVKQEADESLSLADKVANELTKGLEDE